MKRIATFALSAILAGTLQAPAVAQVDASRPVKSSVEAVAAEVEVLVLDSKGVPVEGLTKGDFRLFVNGKETPLDWFETPPAAVAPAPAPAAPVPAPAVRTAAPPALPRRSS